MRRSQPNGQELSGHRHRGSRRRGGVAASCVARSAQERVRRIDVLFSGSSSPETQARHRAFRASATGIGLDGWPQRADRRAMGGWRCIEHSRKYVTQLSTSAPDVILVLGSDATGRVAASQSATVPVVFALVPDPVGSRISSRAWRAQAATPLDSRRSNTASAQNGWNCSRRSRRM